MTKMRMAQKTYSYKLLMLAIFWMSSTAAFAQKDDIKAAFDMPHLMAYLVAGLLISIFVMIFFNRLSGTPAKKSMPNEPNVSIKNFGLIISLLFFCSGNKIKYLLDRHTVFF